MSFNSTTFRQGESSNRFVNNYQLPRIMRKAVINPASTYAGVFTAGMPLKVVSLTNDNLIVDASAQNDSQAQYILAPVINGGQIAVSGVAPAQFVKGQDVAVFQCLGEKEYDFLYTVKTGLSVAALGNATYELATNTVKTAGATDIVIGKFMQSAGTGEVVKVNIKTAGLGIADAITTLV